MQLTWIYANMKIDVDERVEGMCNKCKAEIKKHRCTRCGEKIKEEVHSTNKSFDENKFKALAGDING